MPADRFILVAFVVVGIACVCFVEFLIAGHGFMFVGSWSWFVRCFVLLFVAVVCSV